MVILGSIGRGKRYTLLRALCESIMKVLYFRDWPSKIYDLLNQNKPARIISQSIRLTDKTLDRSASRSIKVIFISDLHIGPTTSSNLLKSTFQKINELSPDLLLLGGDYIFLDATDDRLSLLTSLLSQVTCRNIVGVVGNHDLWADDRRIVDTLQRAGVRVLINENTVVDINGFAVEIVGLDDPHCGDCNVDKCKNSNGNADIRIVLCHSPEGLRYLDGITFDAFLCGHTHGGQVASPWGPIIVPQGQLCRKYTSGFKDHESGLLFVSRGIGTVELPLRLFAPPDFLVLDVIV